MKVVKTLKKLPDEAKAPGYAVHFLEMDDGSKRVWKPDIAITTLKEVVAYRASAWMGLDVVPETVPFSLEGVPGSLQRFVEGKMGTEIYRDEQEVSYQFAQRLALFDYIMNNNDRWHVNVIVDNGNRIWAIDNAGILQNRDAWAASAWSIVGRILEPSVHTAALRAGLQMSDLVRVIFSTEVPGSNGLCRGTDLWTGVHIMCEKIASLGYAVGFPQRMFDRWGSINFYQVAYNAGYPREQYGK